MIALRNYTSFLLVAVAAVTCVECSRSPEMSAARIWISNGRRLRQGYGGEEMHHYHDHELRDNLETFATKCHRLNNTLFKLCENSDKDAAKGFTHSML